MRDDDNTTSHHHPRHQELRYHEEGAGLARQSRRRLRVPRLKTQGIDRARLETWARQVGWETLLNRAGTTFRKLPDADRAGLTEAKAIDLMIAQPSMIKRPVLDVGGGRLIVGFKPDTYSREFALRLAAERKAKLARGA